MTRPVSLYGGEIQIRWLDALREARPYTLTVEQEAGCVETVDELGLPEQVVLSTAESLASQWPYKKHKRLDLTFRAWLRMAADRRAPKPYEAERARSDSFIQDYTARQRARGQAPDQRRQA